MSTCMHACAGTHIYVYNNSRQTYRPHRVPRPMPVPGLGEGVVEERFLSMLPTAVNS